MRVASLSKIEDSWTVWSSSQGAQYPSQGSVPVGKPLSLSVPRVHGPKAWRSKSSGSRTQVPGSCLVLGVSTLLM